jgi:integrase/recombinase XerC
VLKRCWLPCKKASHLPNTDTDTDADTNALQNAETARYLRSLVVSRRHAPGTLINYQRDLERLSELSGSSDLASLAMHDIRRCMIMLNKQGLHGKSIAHALSVWRGFYDWLYEQGLTSANPVVGLKAPRTSKPLPKALSVDNAVQLASFVGDESAMANRDNAMIELMYSCALRRAELVSLDWRHHKSASYDSKSWLDLDNLEVNVIGKGAKRRIVPIGEKALNALKAWLLTRATQLSAKSSEDAQAALFLGAQGERINAGVVYARVRMAAVEAGLPTSVHPHMLRHSAASHVLQSSGDLRGVQEFLGHANISTTQIYTKLDWQHLAKFYDAAHPRAKRKV